MLLPEGGPLRPLQDGKAAPDALWACACGRSALTGDFERGGEAGVPVSERLMRLPGGMYLLG